MLRLDFLYKSSKMFLVGASRKNPELLCGDPAAPASSSSSSSSMRPPPKVDRIRSLLPIRVLIHPYLRLLVFTDIKLFNLILNTKSSIKVFCNYIGWVRSARALNSWMTSVSYACDCHMRALMHQNIALI